MPLFQLDDCAEAEGEEEAKCTGGEGYAFFNLKSTILMIMNGLNLTLMGENVRFCARLSCPFQGPLTTAKAESQGLWRTVLLLCAVGG